METDSSTSATMSLFLCATTAVIALVSFSLVLLARAGKNRKADAGRLPPGPPALLFLAKFLALHLRRPGPAAL
jgi:hypothetical protein